jgi:L-ascorbate oxidase
VSVRGAVMNPAQDFITTARFPVQPSFLADIPDTAITRRRELTFGAGNSTINNKEFQDHHFDQVMLLNTAEEWTVKNAANDKQHPFHIHINPFQITEIFEPNAAVADSVGNVCYVNNNDPTTWKPCASTQSKGPGRVWWDTFAIPTARQVNITTQCQKTGDTLSVANCPTALQPYTACVNGSKPKCTETIPGWFRMRTRFVDYTGAYVLHCHILIHEDRGMMQLIEVVPSMTPYGHH